jgi:hypothetical protein
MYSIEARLVKHTQYEPTTNQQASHVLVLEREGVGLLGEEQGLQVLGVEGENGHGGLLLVRLFDCVFFLSWVTLLTDVRSTQSSPSTQAHEPC